MQYYQAGYIVFKKAVSILIFTFFSSKDVDDFNIDRNPNLVYGKKDDELSQVQRHNFGLMPFQYSD